MYGRILKISSHFVFIALFTAASFTECACSEQFSELWGKEGEKWSATSRLPDFSHAGYQRGEKKIPEVPVAASVKDFGAVGDGSTDDTEAIKKAIEETKRGAIYLPEGIYLLTDIIEIKKPNIVLRGAGLSKTIILCPTPLQAIRPNIGATTGGRPTSNYSWSGGFIWFRGSFQSKEISPILGTAKRGDTRIQAQETGSLKPGQEIEIRQRDTKENTLAAHLYSGDPGNTDELKGRTSASLVSKIKSIDNGWIEIDRPLRFDIEQEWQPQILEFNPTVTESGIEDIGFVFPNTPYEGHFTEWGNNPIALTAVAHCWVRNIGMMNADSGIFAGGRFCTIQGVVYESERRVDPQNHCTGHHGIYMSNDDNLFTEFDFRTPFIHDITVSHCAGNVSSNGKGVDICFDHHKRNPYSNLFTNIDIGEGNRMWKCGGGANLGRHSAAYETFWNIRAQQPQSWPNGFGPDSMNLVGLHTDQPSNTQAEGKWFEAIPPGEISPQNLHEAQLEKRMKQD